MRKLLERELRLFDLIDPRDLRSYAWYHGSTLPGGRRGAEAEIPCDGDFLVRDCASQPGNYVLSVRHKGQALHFVINKVRASSTLYPAYTWCISRTGARARGRYGVSRVHSATYGISKSPGRVHLGALSATARDLVECLSRDRSWGSSYVAPAYEKS